MSKPAPIVPLATPYGPHAREDGDLSDLLSELRILLPGAQMLTAFLIILPFNAGARQIIQEGRMAFLATFFCALSSLVLLSAPAIQHRLMRPLCNRARFKRLATRQIVAGSVALGLAFILGAHLVISQVFGAAAGWVAGAVTALLISTVWWVLPLYLKHKHDF